MTAALLPSEAPLSLPGPAFRYENPHIDRLVFGEAAAHVVAEQASRLNAGRVLILTSASLGDSPLIASLQTALGQRHAATFAAIKPGAPRPDILAAAGMAREVRADLLVAVGGGSVIDAAKLVQICRWEQIEATEELSEYDAERLSAVDPGLDALRAIAVPTTLSGAEFATLGGAFNPANGRKEPFDHPLFVPRVIVSDPLALAGTPLPLVLTTGIRMVDHCVERFCSSDAQPFSDALAVGALKLLLTHLPALAEKRAARADYAQLQIASWMSMDAVNAAVAVGASHAIGRVLGAASGIAHGHTSAILLPAVLSWNAGDPAALARQQELARQIGHAGSLARIIANFIESLGQPRQLSKAGVQRAMLPRIAEDAMVMLRHPSVGGNMRPIRSKQDVIDILELAW